MCAAVVGLLLGAPNVELLLFTALVVVLLLLFNSNNSRGPPTFYCSSPRFPERAVGYGFAMCTSPMNDTKQLQDSKQMHVCFSPELFSELTPFYELLHEADEALVLIQA